MLFYLNRLKNLRYLSIRMMSKLDRAYKSISEVAEVLNLKNKNKLSTHTIRYWEKEFKQIKPKIFNSRRYYDKKNIEILKKIKFLLKDEGLKIEGVKKVLNNADTLLLDDRINKSITSTDKLLKYKLTKIATLVKEIKEIK